MAKKRTSDIAREAAQLAILVDELPEPRNARERALFRKIKLRARRIDQATVGEKSKATRIATFAKWVAELAVIIMEFLRLFHRDPGQHS